MAGENRGGVQPPESSRLKRVLKGLVLAGALGAAAVEGGSRLGVKSAGTASESKSSADENGEEGGLQKKEKTNKPANSEIDNTNNSGVKKEEVKSEKDGSVNKADMTSPNFTILSRLLSSELKTKSLSLERGVSENGNLHCYFVAENKEEEERFAGLEVVINDDGSFELKDGSESEHFDGVDGLVEGIKSKTSANVNSIRSGKTVKGIPENQEELKRQAAEMLPRGDELKN
jgi:hypothetical protein